MRTVLKIRVLDIFFFSLRVRLQCFIFSSYKSDAFTPSGVSGARETSEMIKGFVTRCSLTDLSRV